MTKVHVQRGPIPPTASVKFSTLSLVYTTGYVVNLVLMPFKAYLSEPFPWNLQPLSSDLLPSNGSYEAFANATYSYLSAKYNNSTNAASVVFSRDTDTNTYMLRNTIKLPEQGDDRCMQYMPLFPGAIFYSYGVTSFVCDFLARNASGRLESTLFYCQEDILANTKFGVSCTWAELSNDAASASTYEIYHAVQIVESVVLSWAKFGLRAVHSCYIVFLIWNLYYRHYEPLVHNLRTIGLDDKSCRYIVQLGDPTWLILSHPFVSAIMVIDNYICLGYGSAAINRTSQGTDVGEFCLGCLYGSRTVWAAYAAMRYTTPIIKCMQWEQNFQPVDPGLLALLAIFYAGPVMYVVTRTPIICIFQWLDAVAVPPAQRNQLLEGDPGVVVFFLMMAMVPFVTSFLAQLMLRHCKQCKRFDKRRQSILTYTSLRFNDWKHRVLFYWQRRHVCVNYIGGTLYLLYDENPRYQKLPLFSSRGSDCFVTCWDDVGVAKSRVRLSLIQALDCQLNCASLAIPLCHSHHDVLAVGKRLHLGANNCQWIQ
ncbi:Aste57867_19746 [Aphanomyces stellatus]|uniref:Aste57867_19746 protein n=1 Tax=Aphanomyces stellatus TaxID=120398 RepID=A0A485LD50_9STRA|nr:hypothetical protein As57867_019681 [Aphanomyces stellatus]VFT96444.1 Aste57867_19746 [Aphanomyces stellatus]